MKNFSGSNVPSRPGPLLILAFFQPDSFPDVYDDPILLFFDTSNPFSPLSLFLFLQTIYLTFGQGNVSCRSENRAQMQFFHSLTSLLQRFAQNTAPGQIKMGCTKTAASHFFAPSFGRFEFAVRSYKFRCRFLYWGLISDYCAILMSKSTLLLTWTDRQ